MLKYHPYGKQVYRRERDLVWSLFAISLHVRMNRANLSILNWHCPDRPTFIRGRLGAGSLTGLCCALDHRNPVSLLVSSLTETVSSAAIIIDSYNEANRATKRTIH